MGPLKTPKTAEARRRSGRTASGEVRKPVVAIRQVKGIQVPLGATLVPLSEIRPLKDNPRDHPEEEIKALAAFMMEVGFVVPIVVDADGNVAAGHARILAAKQLGMDKVPVVRVDYLTEGQLRAFVVADNKLPAMARWNPGRLSSYLDSIKLDYPDLRLVGFSDEELRRLRDDLDRVRLDGPGTSHGGDGDEGRSDGGAVPSEPEPERDEEELVPFSILLTPDEREEIYAAVRKVKDRGHAMQTGAALLTIIREWSDDRTG